jgi:chromosome segregation ATPase
MASNADALKVLHKARQTVVEKISELNAAHIRSEMRLAGLEFDLTRCREALERGDTSEDFQSSLNTLESEFQEVESTRKNIDLERDTLTNKLHQIDQQMYALD